MKIIDILNKKANGTLEDGFKFCYKNKVFTYNKKEESIYYENSVRELGEQYKIERILNNEVLLFQEEVKETEKRDKEKEIKELNYYTVISAVPGKFKENVDKELQKITSKINEIGDKVNKLIKEREEK